MVLRSRKNSQLESAAFARERVIYSFIAGALAAWIVSIFYSWKYAPLAGWDVAVVVFLVWIVLSLRGRDSEETARLAKREDPGHPIVDVILVLASMISLGAVGVLLIQASSESGTTRAVLITLAFLSVILSWLMIHTIYMLKYARLYYKEDKGIDFYSKIPPRYSDFAYIAFTIGMTFQVSDNNFTTNEFRRTALRHALLSFLFGTVILASVINVIAGLGK